MKAANLLSKAVYFLSIYQTLSDRKMIFTKASKMNKKICNLILKSHKVMDISMGLVTISRITLKMIIKNNQEAQIIQAIYQAQKYLQDSTALFQKNKKFN